MIGLLCQLKISSVCRGRSTGYSGLSKKNCCEPCNELLVQEFWGNRNKKQVSNPPKDYRSQKQKERDAKRPKEEFDRKRFEEIV